MDNKREAERILKNVPRLRLPISGPTSLEPVFKENVIAQYASFARTFGHPKSVLYPSCEVDASPAKAFPNAEVTLLDKEEKYAEALRRHGLRAVTADIRNYPPESKHDLIILLNPEIPSELVTKHVKRGGYILANNYHLNAEQLLAHPDFKIMGKISERDAHLTTELSDPKAEMRRVDDFFIFKKIR